MLLCYHWIPIYLLVQIQLTLMEWSNPMRVQKYKVVLSAKQRKRLKALSQRGQVSARKLAPRPYPATGRPKPASRGNE